MKLVQKVQKDKKEKKLRKIRKKPNIYALFQFVAFVALIFALIGIVIIGYMIFLEHTANGKPVSFSKAKWMEGFGNVLQFSSDSKLIFPAALLIYSSFTLFVFSWYIGTRIFYCKNRTLFDSLFLVFMMIPILANLFALIAQFVEKEFFIAEVKIDKDVIIQEQTELIKLEINKEKKKMQSRKIRLAKVNERIKLKVEEEEKKKFHIHKHTKKKVSTVKKATKKPVAKKKTTKKPVAKKKTTKKPVAKKKTTKKKK